MTVTTNPIYTEVLHDHKLNCYNNNVNYFSTAGLCSSVSVLLSSHSQCFSWSWYHHWGISSDISRDMDSYWCVHSNQN